MSHWQCEIWPRLLLIANRKSYTGSRLPLNSITLDDLERQNRVFLFFGDFRLQNTFQERIALKLIEIDTEKLHMTFSALNVDFLGLRKPAPEGIKEWYTTKVVFLPLLANLSGEWLQIGMGVLLITSDDLFSRINIDDFKKAWTSKVRGF